MRKHFLIIMISILSLASCNKHVKSFSYHKTKVIAHRGFSGIAPENTMISFRKAIASHADYLELDVHKSKDGKLVVIHDYSIDRTSSDSEKGEISQMTFDQLVHTKVGFPKKFSVQFEDQKIPSLRDVLSLAKGKIKVCIEIKVHDIEKEVLSLVHKLSMEEEVIIFSFHYDVLTRIRNLNKTIPILYLIDRANRATISYANLINANAIGVGYATEPTKEFIDYAHNNGIEVWKWTINKEEQMIQMEGIGLDGIITNYPDKASIICNHINKK